MYKHIIPKNISDNGDFFNGEIKKRNLYEAVGIFLVGLLIHKVAFFAVPFIYKTILFLIFVILPTAFAVVGINDKSLLEALGNIIRYYRMRDILPYSLQTDNDDVLLSKEDAKAKEKEERKALKRARKGKGEKTAKDSKKDTDRKRSGRKPEAEKNGRSDKNRKKENPRGRNEKSRRNKSDKYRNGKRQKASRKEKNTAPSWEEEFF